MKYAGILREDEEIVGERKKETRKRGRKNGNRKHYMESLYGIQKR